MKKKCSRCGEEKDETLFYPCPTTSDFLMSHCSACQKIYAKESRNRRAAAYEEFKRQRKLKELLNDGSENV